jgi:3-oxoacyl-[acyl-carrier protein] reductase
MSGVGPGLGWASTTLFAQEGARVAVTARRREHLEETVGHIRSLGGQAAALQGDVSVKSEAERVVREAMERYGHIDILYSAAGGNFDPNRDFGDVDEAFWSQTMTNTVTGLYNLAQAVHPFMKEQGRGAIVTVAASFSVRQEGNAAYGAAKGGVIGLSQNLAREFYPDNIRVNCIAAGLFRGKLGEGKVSPAAPTLARTGHPQDIGYAALYLASDEAAWVTGQVLSVDGGVDSGTRPLWKYER